MAAAQQQFCLRCKKVVLEVLPASDEKITFYRCPKCGREFAQVPGKSLTERWLGALSLVLYGVIFSPRPQDEARRIADMFRDERSVEVLAWIVGEIRFEIAHPTQKIQDIHGVSQSEEDLREFLTRVADILSKELEDVPVLQTLQGHVDWIRSLVFSPDGEMLASGSSSDSVKLWDIASSRMLHLWRGHKDKVYAVAINQRNFLQL